MTAPAPRATTATTEERSKLLAAAPPWLKLWILLCSDLAMRATTAYRVCAEQYDANARTLTFKTKFGTWQVLPVTEEIARLIATARPTPDPTTPYVCALHRLGRVDPKYPSMAFWQLRQDLGIKRKLTAHDLRRTTAKAIYDATRDLRPVQALLGHKHLSTTLYYLDHRNTPVDLRLLELAKLNPKIRHNPLKGGIP